jgi:hypothetical protein
MISSPEYGGRPDVTRGAALAGYAVPHSLRMAHAGLERDLQRTLELGGTAGIVARNTALAIGSHFRNEEEYVFPLIGYLSALPGGRAVPEAEEVQIMTCRLQAELPVLLEDHRTITDALDGISDAAGDAAGGRLAAFAERFSLHARTEEEILYPAAILVGEALDGRLREFNTLRRYYMRR